MAINCCIFCYSFCPFLYFSIYQDAFSSNMSFSCCCIDPFDMQLLIICFLDPFCTTRMICFQKKVYGFGTMACLYWVHSELWLLGQCWDLKRRERLAGILSRNIARRCFHNWHHSLARLQKWSSIMLFLYVYCSRIYVDIFSFNLVFWRVGFS